MTDDTQPEALRALAEAAKWTGKWYDAGCNTVYCTYDKEDSILHDEIAHPVPFGVSGYIAAAHPQAVIALLDRIAELESELAAVGAGGVQALSAAPAIGDELRDTLVAVSAAIAERDDRAAQKMIVKILAASPTPPAEQQAEESSVKLLAECRDAFPIPEPSSPLEVQWSAAMARPEEVPEYVRLCVAAMQAAPKAAPGESDYSKKWDVELGRTAMRFVDRAGDVHPGIDDAETICAEFHKAMSEVIERMPHVQRMAAPQPAPATRQAANYPPLPTAIGFAHFFEGELINAHSPRFQAEFNEEGEFDDHNVELFTADQMRAYVDADRTARASAESAERDAERYRWLRAPRLAAGQGSITVELDDRANGNFSRSIFLADLDSAIDAALAAQKGTP